MNREQRIDFQVRRWELNNDTYTPFERQYYADHMGAPAVAHEVELPEHDFPLDMVDPSNVRPIRPPQPPEIVA